MPAPSLTSGPGVLKPRLEEANTPEATNWLRLVKATERETFRGISPDWLCGEDQLVCLHFCGDQPFFKGGVANGCVI